MLPKNKTLIHDTMFLLSLPCVYCLCLPFNRVFWKALQSYKKKTLVVLENPTLVAKGSILQATTEAEVDSVE